MGRFIEAINDLGPSATFLMRPSSLSRFLEMIVGSLRATPVKNTHVSSVRIPKQIIT